MDLKKETTAVALIEALEKYGPMELENSDLANELNVKPPYPLEMTIKSITMKDEKKQAPLLYNLAELQNDCSKMFKISPDETLNVVQQLYEAKLVTYPRTDARVLSTAVQ